MKKPVKSIRHKADKRAHIPSGEEAGYEAGSARVQELPDDRGLPLNPVIHRGKDPELFWMHKYQTDTQLTGKLKMLDEHLKSGDTAAARAGLSALRETIEQRYTLPGDAQRSVDIRSLYRHEHIAPEALIKGLYRVVAGEKADSPELFSVNELFGNALAHEELDKVSDYYTHSDGWTNRLMQGDSLLSMTSLLEREGMAGHVQCFYFDPPYGIKYGSNWQIRLNNTTMSSGQRDEDLSGEPEQIKAFRDTWELGIHSYLSYLRDRLLIARELLHDSGSCFVQISDENVHLVRCLMDEVFGSANFAALISFKKTTGQTSENLPGTSDYVLWYAKDKERLKFRPLYKEREIGGEGAEAYASIRQENGSVRRLTPEELANPRSIPKGVRAFRYQILQSQREGRPSGPGSAMYFEIQFEGRKFVPSGSRGWTTTREGMESLKEAGRIGIQGNSLSYIRYLDDFPAVPLNNLWNDTQSGSGMEKLYVVQTNQKVIQRCILMTTDPGDLVLDPTCGSGTTAYVAEQWGRRWITTDTSRIALNIAKTRLMTATFPFYTLYDTEEGDRAVVEKKGKPGKHDALEKRDPKQPLRGHNVRYGFVYEKIRHVMLKGIAKNEPPAEETLYDKPLKDNKRLRVAGPFTVETLQSYEPISPEELARQREQVEELAAFEDLIFEHLKAAGVKTGDKSEQAVFTRIDRLSSTALHAEGFYETKSGEKKAYLHIGPKFGTVSKQAVNEAIKACRARHDADWLMILAFSFESGLSDVTTKDFGSFQVSIVRMHDDLLQEGLLKKDRKAASFVTIGEPDIRLHRKNGTATVEIVGLDIYDPIRDEVKSRDVHDIAYWMLDDDYDGSNFVVRQVFFCGGDKDEFDQWKKELSNLAAAAARKKAEQTLKLEIDDEAFAHAYGHQSRPFPMKKGQKVAVRVVSQYGEETTKVLGA